MGSDKNDCPSPCSSNEQMKIPISISTMTGQTWVENIAYDETVQSLKIKIWRRCGLLPYHQGLIFGDKSLPKNNEGACLKDMGIRKNSLIRLVLVTRSGPVALQHAIQTTRSVEIEVAGGSCSTECWDGGRGFSEEFLKENRRTLFKMCELRRQMRAHASTTKPIPENLDNFVVSAPEDTSAKESSAGDTECDDEKLSFRGTHEKVSELSLPYCSRLGIRRERHCSTKAEIYEENSCAVRDTELSARDRLLVMMQSRSESPNELNAPSEDGSEFSSGMIICDLSNEFRRLRVRRRHHVANNTNAAQKMHNKKLKPATFIVAHSHKGSDLTSSDDERPSLRRTLDATCANIRRPNTTASCSAFRRPPASTRGQRASSGFQSQHRCYTCASKFNNFSLAFHCRCGKKLCPRHRPADMHTCVRLRKMQDVSD